MSKKIFSGVQPTGNLHLGNYLGAIKNFVDLNNNNDNECIFCVVDLHAITVKQNPKELKNKIGDSNLELIAVLPNLKLPFKVHQTIPIQEFDAGTLNIDKEKLYIMVCQRGLNSYRATVQLKEKYPRLQVLNLTGGISSY